MFRPTLLAVALVACSAFGQTPTKPAVAEARRPPMEAPSATDTVRGEPNVQHIVNEDKGSKIDELKIRGNTTRITVTPKVGTTRGYEIITEDGSRDISDGLTGSRGAAGKRVWRVLSF